MKKLFALIAACMVGCTAGHVNMTTYEPDKGSRSVSVDMQVGGIIEFDLIENATTGYTWSAVNNHHITDVSFSSVEVADNEICGAPGKQRVAIRALNKGITKVYFHYSRMWEQNIPPFSTLVYTINIE